MIIPPRWHTKMTNEKYMTDISRSLFFLESEMNLIKQKKVNKL